MRKRDWRIKAAWVCASALPALVIMTQCCSFQSGQCPRTGTPGFTDPLLIQGVWAPNEEENALFTVSADTLYYTEHLTEPVCYELIGDTLHIHGTPWVKCLILKLTEDSLCFLPDSAEQPTRLYRRK